MSLGSVFTSVSASKFSEAFLTATSNITQAPLLNPEGLELLITLLDSYAPLRNKKKRMIAIKTCYG